MRHLVNLFLLLLAGGACAEVMDKAAGGFTVKLKIDIETAPANVFTVFTERVGHWWHPDHTFGGDASKLTIDARPGGCFCEQLDGGGLQHLQISYTDAGKQLRMRGGLGPLHDRGVTGNMKIEFEGQDSTSLTLTYAVGGYLPAGLNSWAEAVDFVLNQQLARLKRLIETGTSDPA